MHGLIHTLLPGGYLAWLAKLNWAKFLSQYKVCAIGKIFSCCIQYLKQVNISTFSSDVAKSVPIRIKLLSNDDLIIMTKYLVVCENK